jgi:hypothetical protein
MMIKNNLKIFNYLKHSSILVTLIVNPLHWHLIPNFYKNEDVWSGNSLIFKFLFVVVSVSIDDGSW